MNRFTKTSILALFFLLIINTQNVFADILIDKSGKDDGEKLKKIMILFLAKNYENKKILEDEEIPSYTINNR